MDDIRLKTLQQCAIQNVMARTSESAEKSIAIRQPFNDLHIAAFMDIEKTTYSLQHILEYKKELAVRTLRCSDEKELELYVEALKHAESLIKKVLGMCI
jgi:phytoene/squalene synthetase